MTAHLRKEGACSLPYLVRLGVHLAPCYIFPKGRRLETTNGIIVLIGVL